jgi:hypothetical protein
LAMISSLILESDRTLPQATENFKSGVRAKKRPGEPGRFDG